MSRIPSIVISDESLVSAHDWRTPPHEFSWNAMGDRVVAEFSGDDRDKQSSGAYCTWSTHQIGFERTLARDDSKYRWILSGAVFSA